MARPSSDWVLTMHEILSAQFCFASCLARSGVECQDQENGEKSANCKRSKNNKCRNHLVENRLEWNMQRNWDVLIPAFIARWDIQAISRTIEYSHWSVTNGSFLADLDFFTIFPSAYDVLRDSNFLHWSNVVRNKRGVHGKSAEADKYIASLQKSGNRYELFIIS